MTGISTARRTCLQQRERTELAARIIGQESCPDAHLPEALRDDGIDPLSLRASAPRRQWSPMR